ncbi:hypothetical protein [Natrinema sp. CBA1119]|uniref:hypothetical protein n=1 Tax=Natrinema sp. CBA1119 TaxID=1608465 RepID=UPI001145A70A|nr:hypothetical protein [Natrinema sp. CBA1119]
MRTKRSIEDIDRHILTYLKKSSPSTPKDISKDRFRENVVRLRCQQLTRENLIIEITHDLYNLSGRGEEYVTSDDRLDEFRESFPDPEVDRITDFTELDPEDIKWRNREYFNNPDHRYDHGDVLSYHQVKHRISVVRNGDLDRVMGEFPKREPLTQQCAHWVRAIIGLHFFPDANHRTAMATLNTLLPLNGIEKFSWSDDQYKKTIFKSKLIRKYIIDVRFDNLWSKDELYFLWHRYFVDRFYDISDFSHHSPDYERLDQVIEQL